MKLTVIRYQALVAIAVGNGRGHSPCAGEVGADMTPGREYDDLKRGHRRASGAIAWLHASGFVRRRMAGWCLTAEGASLLSAETEELRLYVAGWKREVRRAGDALDRCIERGLWA